MMVNICPIRRAESWGYLAGSWGETTLHFVIILIDIKGNETMFRLYLLQ